MDHPDRTLLQTFVATRHSDDFTPIVRQYLNLVYSTALRLVSGDHSQAEDICQNVFTDLVRKADRIPEAMPLAAWLYRHTSFLAANVRRAESRRLKRETEANAMAEKVVSGPVEIPGEELHLALNELAEADRDILVLRFFEELDLRRVGLRFGIGEDAAQKRVPGPWNACGNRWVGSAFRPRWQD